MQIAEQERLDAKNREQSVAEALKLRNKSKFRNIFTIVTRLNTIRDFFKSKKSQSVFC